MHVSTLSRGKSIAHNLNLEYNPRYKLKEVLKGLRDEKQILLQEDRHKRNERIILCHVFEKPDPTLDIFNRDGEVPLFATEFLSEDEDD